MRPPKLEPCVFCGSPAYGRFPGSGAWFVVSCPAKKGCLLPRCEECSTDHTPAGRSAVRRVAVQRWNAAMKRAGMGAGLRLSQRDATLLVGMLREWHDPDDDGPSNRMIRRVLERLQPPKLARRKR